jgi:hypothetical protein
VLLSTVSKVCDTAEEHARPAINFTDITREPGSLRVANMSFARRPHRTAATTSTTPISGAAITIVIMYATRQKREPNRSKSCLLTC